MYFHGSPSVMTVSQWEGTAEDGFPVQNTTSRARGARRMSGKTHWSGSALSDSPWPSSRTSAVPVLRISIQSEDSPASSRRVVPFELMTSLMTTCARMVDERRRKASSPYSRLGIRNDDDLGCAGPTLDHNQFPASPRGIKAAWLAHARGAGSDRGGIAFAAFVLSFVEHDHDHLQDTREPGRPARVPGAEPESVQVHHLPGGARASLEATQEGLYPQGLRSRQIALRCAARPFRPLHEPAPPRGARCLRDAS